VKAVPSYKHKDKKLFYLLQRELGRGHDGITHLAKRKEEVVLIAG